MTQDYVRSARPSRKRKPASRSGSTRRAAPPAFPIVRVVLAAALVIGFAIFLYVLKGSADDPHRNFPSVGDKQLFQHQDSSARTAPAITGSSLSVTKRTAVPATSDFTS